MKVPYGCVKIFATWNKNVPGNGNFGKGTTYKRKKEARMDLQQTELEHPIRWDNNRGEKWVEMSIEDEIG